MLTLCGVTADDVVYTVLPLYHTMGLVLGVLSCLELGKPFSEDHPPIHRTARLDVKAPEVTQHPRFLPSTRDSEPQGYLDRGLDTQTVLNGCAVVRR